MNTRSQAVRFARQFTDNVEFSPEDAGRSDVEFLCRVLEAVIEAGATTLNIPDTVGYAIPDQFGELIRTLRTRIPNSDKAVFSVHCHNDLGLAVANSLSAVRNGARQVECTINGLGERAGNAALEEIVMAVRTRSDVYGCDTHVDTTQIVPASRLVAGVTGFAVQPNKAIVGANAFAHESGIHQDGVIKHRETYEIMRAEDVGWRENRLVLGKHSGRNAFKKRLAEIGVELASEDAMNIAFSKFKELADKKHDIFDEDLNALVSDEAVTPEQEYYRLLSMAVHSETGETPVCAGDHRRRWCGASVGSAGQRPGRCVLQGHRGDRAQRCSVTAVLGQQYYERDRRAGRGDGAAFQGRPHRERTGGGHGHRGRVQPKPISQPSTSCTAGWSGRTRNSSQGEETASRGVRCGGGRLLIDRRCRRQGRWVEAGYAGRAARAQASHILRSMRAWHCAHVCR